MKLFILGPQIVLSILVLIVSIIAYFSLLDFWKNESIASFPAVNEFAKAGQFINYNGSAIFYRCIESTQVKNDKVLLLIHGYPTSSYDFALLIPTLENHFGKIILFDMIGFGFSDKPKIDYRIKTQADIATYVLQQCGIASSSSINILSHDYGVTVAQELLARSNEPESLINPFPFSIKSSLFLNGGLFNEAYRPLTSMVILRLGYLGPLFEYFAVIRPIIYLSLKRVFGGKRYLTDQENEELFAIITHKYTHGLLHRLVYYMTEREDPILSKRWKNALLNTKAKLKFVNGPADPVSGRHMAEYYRTFVPNSDVLLLDDNVGHWPQLEDREAVERALNDFYKNNV